MLFANFDYTVFGNHHFLLTDSLLFADAYPGINPQDVGNYQNGRPITLAVPEEGLFAPVTECFGPALVITTFVPSGQCNCITAPVCNDWFTGCDPCSITISVSTFCNPSTCRGITIECGGGAPPPLPGDGGGGGGGGSGSGGGNNPEPPPPCEVDCDGGWLPTLPPPNKNNDPCKQLKRLFNTPKPDIKPIIIDSLQPFITANLTGEKGVLLTKAATDSITISMMPATTNNEIQVPTGGDRYSAIHTHETISYPMFSWSDVYKLHNLSINIASHNTGQASFLLTAKHDNGTFETYAIVFDTTGTTLNDFFNNPENVGCTHQEIIDKMNKKLAKEYETEAINGTYNYEKVFLRANFGLNVSLYKANSTLTNWSKLSISSNSATATVNSTNCN